MSDLRARLKKLTARRYKSIDVPGLGSLRVRSLCERERSLVEETIGRDSKLIKAALVQYSLVDETDQLVYGPDDQAEILELDSSIVDRIAGAAMSLNKVEEADIRKMLGEPAPTSTTTLSCSSPSV